MMYEWPW